MLRIRLQRVGKKNDPSFRIVLTDSRNSTKSGKYLEVLGHWDFRDKKRDKRLEADKIRHWLLRGAQATDTVHNILVSEKVIEGKKINVLPPKSRMKKEGKKGKEKTETAKPAEAAEEEAEEENKEKEEPKPETEIKASAEAESGAKAEIPVLQFP